jgi:glutaredoxin-related protein
MAIFVDITDLYYKLLKKFGSGKLDYEKYLEQIPDQDKQNKYAYGCQENNEAAPFIKYLRSLGFITKYKHPYTLKIGDRNIKRCNWLVGVAVDALTEKNNGEVNFYFGVSNPDIAPLVKCLKRNKCNVEIVACNIPESLKRITKFREVTQEILESHDVSGSD